MGGLHALWLTRALAQRRPTPLYAIGLYDEADVHLLRLSLFAAAGAPQTSEPHAFSEHAARLAVAAACKACASIWRLERAAADFSAGRTEKPIMLGRSVYISYIQVPRE